MSILILLLVGSALATALATGWVYAKALRDGMVDVPNQRSSHLVPVPRGGGIAMVTAFSAGMIVIVAIVSVPVPLGLFTALVPGALAVAWVGWIDDRRGVSAPVRALVHAGAAIWAVAWLGGLPMLRIGSLELPLGIAGAALAVLGIVWFLNLFNFMDGIDGIASSQAVAISLVAGAMAWARSDVSVAAAYMLLAGASIGFMLWNWPPARIFMGDVGSGFLGYVLAVLAIAGELRGSVPLAVWIVLVSVFAFDATVTLIRRLIRRERVYEAHRKHAYQRAVMSGLSHRTVTLGALALTSTLGAWASVAMRRPSVTGLIIFGALLLLTIVYVAIERRQPMT
jgi:Fuc2NAc and GlcNAc transferase